jgi:hypothetical protein
MLDAARGAWIEWSPVASTLCRSASSSSAVAHLPARPCLLARCALSSRVCAGTPPSTCCRRCPCRGRAASCSAPARADTRDRTNAEPSNRDGISHMRHSVYSIRLAARLSRVHLRAATDEQLLELVGQRLAAVRDVQVAQHEHQLRQTARTRECRGAIAVSIA